MKEEKREKKSTKKIVLFDIDEALLRDHEMDLFLAESLKREADELEAELNRDARLQGADVSDTLFQSIVAELKAKGIWQEDPPERGGSEAPAADLEGRALTAEPKRKASERTVKSEMLENLVKLGMLESIAKGGMPEDVAQSQAPEAGPQDKVSEGSSEQAQQQSGKMPLEAVYAMLSDEDRRAMELGKQVEKQNEARRVKRRKRRKVYRRSGLAAAALALVFGTSMTGEANRKLVVRLWNGMTGSSGLRMAANYIDEDENIRSKTAEEMRAMQDIKAGVGVAPITFKYMPLGMEYLRCEIAQDNVEADMFYTYQEKIFMVTMINLNHEGVSYYALDREASLRATVVNAQNIKLQVWETNLDLDEETYVVETEYNDCHYILNGMIEFDELEKMLEHMIIL